MILLCFCYYLSVSRIIYHPLSSLSICIALCLEGSLVMSESVLLIVQLEGMG